MMVSQDSFKAAWTLKINCNKHWLNKIYFVVKKKVYFYKQHFKK